MSVFLESDDLKVSWEPMADYQDGGAAEVGELVGSRVLVSDVESLVIEYFGSRAGAGERVWQQEWDGQDSLPNLISISLSRSKDKAAKWPRLVVLLSS